MAAGDKLLLESGAGDFLLLDSGSGDVLLLEAASGSTATLSGTVTTADESDIAAGGDTTILTLSGDTWVAAGATFNAQRQAIIDGCTSAQSETTGWNNEARDNEVVGAVVRTSDTVVTITWTAAAAYDITANETITVTVPAAALVTSASAVVATPTFTVSFVASGVTPIPPMMHNVGRQFAPITAHRLGGVIQ